MEAIKNLIKKVLTTIFVMIVGITILGYVVGGDDEGSTTVAATTPMSAEERASKIAAIEEEVRSVPASLWPSCPPPPAAPSARRSVNAT